MSRIGKKPVQCPGRYGHIEGQTLTVKGPKGTLSMQLLDADYRSPKALSASRRPTRSAGALLGHAAHVVQNLVTGVTDGFSKVLEITGVGYRAAAQGKNLRLQLGYSHDVNIAVPEDLEVKTPDQVTVEISGTDRQKVGQLAAEIRRWRKPEPYKGKGIKYRGEYIFRKGKKK
jgi:large subunit ribosomal protein L6